VYRHVVGEQMLEQMAPGKSSRAGDQRNAGHIKKIVDP
jgi:hypothetical protein